MYQVLARKYRPRNFYELVGQKHVSKALTSALKRGRLHHAYLFTGTRGVGKTTIARILAKCLNCETGITATPCEQCHICQAVNEGRFIDLIEIDAASRTKVEDTRELLDNVPYAPTQGRFKVYLIDEVHMLSIHSFNALLKTLEEPPIHVKFLFATTDPQKLPITIISRCLQFNLRPLMVEEIQQHLQKLLQLEQISYDESALWQLAESAQGSLRDALSLTDQAIAYGQGQVYQNDVKEMLGLLDRHLIYDLLFALHQNQRQKVAELLLLFRQQAIDVAIVLEQLISALYELALMQHLPDLPLSYSVEIQKKIRFLASQISAPDIQLYYQICCKGREDLNLAITQIQGFEMCILRLLAFRPLDMNEYVPMITQQSSIQSEYSKQIEVIQPHENIDNNAEQYVDIIENINDDVEDNIINNDVVYNCIEENYIQEYHAGNTDIQELKDYYNHIKIVNELRKLEKYRQSDHIFCFEKDILLDVLQEDLKTHQKSIQKTTRNSLSDYLYFTEKNDLFDFNDEIEIPEILSNHLNKMSYIEEGKNHEELEIDWNENDINEDIYHQENVNDISSLSKREIIVENIQSHIEIIPSNNIQEDKQHSPQEILSLSTQELTGIWTAEKWEYCLRRSGLSPMIQGVLQNTVMQGEIGIENHLFLQQDYVGIFNQFEHEIQQYFNDWQHASLILHYVPQLPENMPTPLMLEQQRFAQAQQQAKKWLQNTPVIAQLLDTFSGQIEYIDLGVKS